MQVDKPPPGGFFIKHYFMRLANPRISTWHSKSQTGKVPYAFPCLRLRVPQSKVNALARHNPRFAPVFHVPLTFECRRLTLYLPNGKNNSLCGNPLRIAQTLK